MILEGKTLKYKILDSLKEKVSKLSIKPTLVVIQVGNDEASNVYVKEKGKMCEYVGYGFKHIKLDSNITTLELVDVINKYNMDNLVFGILVQMPLPKHIDVNVVQNAISYKKDVDGLTDINMGSLVHNKKCLVPCTPKGIIELLKYYNIPIKGKDVTIVGRSNLVGKPLVNLFLNEDATVSICHSNTSDLSKYTSNCDILVVAVGKKHLINKSMVKEGTTIIDVGINRDNGKLCGDVCYDEVNDICNITPVPGGVGQMTIAMLASNIYEAYNLSKER